MWRYRGICAKHNQTLCISCYVLLTAFPDWESVRRIHRSGSRVSCMARNAGLFSPATGDPDSGCYHRASATENILHISLCAGVQAKASAEVELCENRAARLIVALFHAVAISVLLSTRELLLRTHQIRAKFSKCTLSDFVM